MTTNFITVQELKDYAPDIDYSRYSDTTISGVITRSTDSVESFIEYTLPWETKTEKVESHIDPDNDLIIYPTKLPVRTLESVSIVKSSFEAALTLTSGSNNLYDLDDDRIVIPGSTITLNTVSVIDFSALRNVKFFTNITYTCGYFLYDRPRELIDAVVLYCRDWFSRSLNTAGASRISQGAVSIQYSSRKGKSDNVKDAEEILSHYRRVSGF